MDDTASGISYYKYDPDGVADGIYDNPHFGELTPGCVVEVRPADVHLVANHPDFRKSTKKHFDEQPSIAEERDRLASPPADA